MEFIKSIAYNLVSYVWKEEEPTPIPPEQPNKFITLTEFLTQNPNVVSEYPLCRDAREMSTISNNSSINDDKLLNRKIFDQKQKQKQKYKKSKNFSPKQKCGA